jgi:hypothetical protein
LPDGLLLLDEEAAGVPAFPDVELDEPLLHAASPVQAMASRATRDALVLVNRWIITRTLPSMVAQRKEP